MNLDALLSLGELSAVSPSPFKISPETFRELFKYSPPDDYFTLINHFGLGEFQNGILGVRLREYTDAKTADSFDNDVSALRSNKEIDPSRFSVFPDRPGLFPWGSDDAGDMYCWLTGTDDESCPIVASTEDDDFVSPLGMIEFLCCILIGDYESAGLSDLVMDVDKSQIRFVRRERRQL